VYCNGHGALGDMKIVVRASGDDPSIEYRTNLARDGVEYKEIPTAGGTVRVPDFGAVAHVTSDMDFKAFWFKSGVAITVSFHADDQSTADHVAAATGASAKEILQAVAAMPVDPR
jgi:hypothetical protein